MERTLNQGHEYRERVERSLVGERLLAYLARRYRHSSPDEWRERIETGRVSLDSASVQADTPIRPGQLLVWHRPPWLEPPAPPAFAVLYRDDALLAVAKPAGLPTLPGAGFLESTLARLVRRHDRDAVPLHRLGRWTSGVVLFARTRAARVAMAQQWRERKVTKRYVALASGRPARREFTVDTPIGPVEHPRLGSLHAASPGGRPALSHVVVRREHEEGFLCDVRIVTGRPHQIRIHLAAAGHPLVGDPLYVAGGLPAPDSTAVPGDSGYLLHAAELGLFHPTDGRQLTVRCAPPPPLR